MFVPSLCTPEQVIIAAIIRTSTWRLVASKLFKQIIPEGSFAEPRASIVALVSSSLDLERNLIDDQCG